MYFTYLNLVMTYMPSFSQYNQILRALFLIDLLSYVPEPDVLITPLVIHTHKYIIPPSAILSTVNLPTHAENLSVYKYGCSISSIIERTFLWYVSVV